MHAGDRPAGMTFRGDLLNFDLRMKQQNTQ
jgi:hypothetical protein